MNVYKRLLMELNNREYFSEEEYIQLLTENGLNKDDIYDKKTMQRKLLLTVLDILRSLGNDSDNLRKLVDGETNFTENELYSKLAKRIEALEKQISEIPLDPEEQYSDISLFFSRRRL